MKNILILISLVCLAHASNINLLMCTPFQKDTPFEEKKEKITIFNSKALKEESFGIFMTNKHIKIISIRNTQEDRESISNILTRKENFIYKETYLDTKKESDGTQLKLKIIIYSRSGTNPKFPEKLTVQKNVKDGQTYYFARHLRLVGEADLSVIHSLCKNFE